MPGQKSDIARRAFVSRTIPNKRDTAAVTTTSSAVDLTPYGGKRLWLRAITANITVLRGANAVVANEGIVLSSASPPVYQEMWVDPDGHKSLNAIVASGTATLEILYDDEQ